MTHSQLQVVGITRGETEFDGLERELVLFVEGPGNEQSGVQAGAEAHFGTSRHQYRLGICDRQATHFFCHVPSIQVPADCSAASFTCPLCTKVSFVVPPLPAKAAMFLPAGQLKPE